MLEQGLDLAAEDQEIGAGLDVEERLLSGRIPGQEHPLFDSIPGGEREHAVESAKPCLAVALEHAYQDLGVTRRLEGDTQATQFVSEIAVVVDLAVVRERRVARAQRHRLMARRQVDDAETSVCETAARVCPDPASIRTAPGERLRHALEHRLRRFGSAKIDEAGEATHG